ncbi:N-acetylglutamate synthase, mitochondrial isoform X2 [Callorhinchus milii]|uniref:N-acetylglutamate synthase, mitochondrial n=1 Tax=Callorhinchus milii TaxID=7868 RepID=A0A4W3HIV9_CALMI|nr:N-acetylglutamate synthase, mitochondrial isoform X2 [Callorhinchus milii]|eukprot:gi/632966785/ref/XP_007899613.1/ PREDICTED: N-acetylglutamate synthase, mitochondrial isoform X2 [Callorhinchus milii]
MGTLSSASAGSRAVGLASHLLSSTKPVSIPSLAGAPAPGLRQLSAVTAWGHRKLWSSPSPAPAPAPATAQEDLSTPLVSHHRATRSLVYRDVKMFLNEMGGDPREARYWLTQFQNASNSCNKLFAVVEVDEEIFGSKEMVSSLAFGLAFLQRMDMKPVVVMGLQYHHQEASDCFTETRSLLLKHCKTLTDALHRNSAVTMPFFNGGTLLQAEKPSTPNSFGSMVSVDENLLTWCLDSGHIPIVCSVGETPDGQLVMLDPLVVTSSIAKAMQPLKVMFLNNSGGIQDNDKVLGQVNLPADLDLLSNVNWVSHKEEQKARVITDLLNYMPSESSAVITSANTILAELFSHQGAGTLFKSAEPIRKYTSLVDIDTARLVSLINKSFEKQLREDYFKRMEPKLQAIYLSEGYSAAAIITMESALNGLPYLDKFVVSTSKRGQGASQMLWECIRQDYDLLFWRSRVTNRINPWYFKQCDGSFANGRWIVFWYGLSDLRDSYKLVDYADSLPDSFIPPKEPVNRELTVSHP